MAIKPHFPGFQLPTQPTQRASRETQGFFTPIEDLIAQVHSVLPMRVLPIIFLPGIMGSNLRMTADSYAHYGADLKRAAWHNVEWAIEDNAQVSSVETLNISSDNGQGRLDLTDAHQLPPSSAAGPTFRATIQGPGDPGDQTVPLHSAEHQLRSRKFKGVFRQSGYEHQDSYKDDRALRSTLYCLVRIAQKMTWAA